MRVDHIQHGIGWVRMVHDCEDTVRCILLLNWLLEVDWDASFSGKAVGSAVRLFPYDFATMEITSLEGVDDGRSRLDAVDVVYKPEQNRATLEACEKEIEVYRNRLTIERELAEKREDAHISSQFGGPRSI